jgi:hypothetical protein
VPFDARVHKGPLLGSTFSAENVLINGAEGLNNDIRWTFVGHGGRKVRHGGIRQMRKKEERYRAFVDNKILNFMHKDRSHLHDFNVSLMASTSFHEYQIMIQEQIFHENKVHDHHFPVLKTEKVSPKDHDKDDGYLFSEMLMMMMMPPPTLPTPMKMKMKQDFHVMCVSMRTT